MVMQLDEPQVKGPGLDAKGLLTEEDVLWFNDVYTYLRNTNRNGNAKLPPKTFVRKLAEPVPGEDHLFIIELVDKSGLPKPNPDDPASRLDSAPFIYFMMKEGHPLLDLYPPPIMRLPLPRTSGLLEPGPATRYTEERMATYAEVYWKSKYTPEGLTVIECDGASKPTLRLNGDAKHTVVQSDVDWFDDLISSQLLTDRDANLPKTIHIQVTTSVPERILLFVEHIDDKEPLPKVELNVPVSRFPRAPYVYVITPTKVATSPLATVSQVGVSSTTPESHGPTMMTQEPARICRDVIPPGKERTAVSDRASTTRLNAVVAEPTLLWPNTDQPIIYRFLNPPSPEGDVRREKVRIAIKEWEKFAAVTFRERLDGENADIKIAFKDDGSWSNIGMDCTRKSQDQASMNFGWIDGRSPHLSDKDRAVILHEFGHALGMLHEHQSPAFGGATIRDDAAVVAYYQEHQGWDERMVRTQILNTYNTKSVTNFSAVDEKSIMMYPLPMEVTGLDHDISFNHELSDMDKAYAVINYPRTLQAEQANTGAREWTLENALKVAGMLTADSDGAQKILAARGKDTRNGFVGPSNIRAIFSNWTLRAHGAKANKREALRPGDAIASGEASHALFTSHLTSPKVLKVPFDKYPCETSLMEAAPPIESLENPFEEVQDNVSHAVMERTWLSRDEAVSIENAGHQPVAVTWTVVESPSLLDRIPGEFETDLIKNSLQKWSVSASIDFRFVELEPDADIVFVFQDYDPLKGEDFKMDDSVYSCRSYTVKQRLGFTEQFKLARSHISRCSKMQMHCEHSVWSQRKKRRSNAASACRK